MLLTDDDQGSMQSFSEDDDSTDSGLSRDSLSTMIYKRLRTNLMTSSFEPGERLNIRHLAEAFETSPTPVREAIMQLVREGGLELRPGHELRVPVLTVERYLKIKAVRAPLERLATETATPLISADTLGDLARINDRFLSAESRKHWKEALSLNTEFHFTIYAASGNEVLLNAIENLWLLTGPFLINQYPSAIHPHDSVHPHLLLMDAIRRRAAREAGELVLRGLEKGSSLIVQKLTSRQAGAAQPDR